MIGVSGVPHAPSPIAKHGGHDADDDRGMAEDADRLPPAEPAAQHVAPEPAGQCRRVERQAECDRSGEQGGARHGEIERTPIREQHQRPEGHDQRRAAGAPA